MANNVQIDPEEDVAVLTRVPDDMERIPGDTFRMGSDRHYADEAPAHRVTVDAFWIDRVPVTNREFRKFVRTTGYTTFAEIVPDPKDYPGALPHMLRAASLVFNPSKHAVDTDNWSQWWTFKFGANWKRPYGPRSSLSGLDGAEFAWGDALTSGGRQMANTWQGAFPHQNLKLDGYERQGNRVNEPSMR